MTKKINNSIWCLLISYLIIMPFCFLSDFAYELIILFGAYNGIVITLLYIIDELKIDYENAN